MNRFDEFVSKGATIKAAPNGEKYVEFVEPIDGEKMFYGKVYEDGEVVGNNVYGAMTL